MRISEKTSRSIQLDPHAINPNLNFFRRDTSLEGQSLSPGPSYVNTLFTQSVSFVPARPLGDLDVKASNIQTYGGFYSVAADLDALERSAASVERTATALQSVTSRLRAAADSMAPTWWQLVRENEHHRAQRLASDCVVMPEFPTPDQTHQFNVLCDAVDDLELSTRSLESGIKDAAEDAFAAALEYEASNKVLLDNFINNLSGVPLAGKQFFTPQRPWFLRDLRDLFDPERGQFSMGENLGRRLLNSGEYWVGAKSLEFITEHLRMFATPQYVPPSEKLTVKKHAPYKVDTLDSLIGTFSSLNASEPGAVQIMKYTDNGKTKYIVNIPGTQKWDPRRKEHPIDVLGNFELMTQDESEGMKYVLEAMKAAGIEPGAEVTLLGHSQGGMIATRLAERKDFLEKYNVRAAVTLNSPTANSKVDSSVVTLNIENKNDMVTMADMEEVPVSGSRVQVTGEVDLQGTQGQHDPRTSQVILRKAQETDRNVQHAVKLIEEGLPETGTPVDITTYDIVQK